MPRHGAAEHLRGEIGVKPFRRVVAGDRQPVAGAKAERVKPDRETARVRQNIPRQLVRRHMPRSFSRNASALAMRLGAMLQHLRHRHRESARELLVHAAARLAPR